MRFFVPGKPRSQGSKTPITRKDGSVWLAEGKTPKARAMFKAAREAVRLYAINAARAAREKPCASAARVEAWFFIDRPKSVRAKYPETTAPDVDKALRLVLDGLTGPALKNDNRVVDIHGYKRWTGPDPTNPGEPFAEFEGIAIVSEPLA